MSFAFRSIVGRVAASLFVAVCLAGSAPRAEIVINEIMYHSTGVVEYVELYNTGPAARDVTGWYMLDDNDTHLKCFLVGTLGVDEYLVIASVIADFTAIYPGVTNLNPNEFDGPGGWGLSNGGDQVRIFDGAGAPVDIVAYDNAGNWPTSPDGTGPSLELINPLLDNSVHSSWRASLPAVPGGTPGVQNSVFAPDAPPFVNDLARNISLPESGNTVVITARPTDDNGIAAVDVFVDVGFGYAFQPMFDNGLNGDGAPGDGIYGLLIGPHSSGTRVRYYVMATDTIGQTATAPTDAPAGYQAYTVDHKPPKLVINEVLASNGTPGEGDWAEIYNPGPEPVALDGMFLSNNFNQPTEWMFPSVMLEPGGYLRVWCDELPGDLHANFKLTKSGDEIALWETVDHGNVLIDGWTFGMQGTDISFGFFPDDADAPEYLKTPTPGASNDTAMLHSPVVINEFLTTGSVMTDDWVELHNRSATTFNIGGYHISDDRDIPAKYTIPVNTMIPPGGFLVFDQTQLGFAFSSDGTEVIMLTHASGGQGQDYFDYGPQGFDISQGRYPNGSANWHFFSPPSQGMSNVCEPVLPDLDLVSGLEFSSATVMTWNPVAGAEAYDTVRGDLAALWSASGSFTPAVTGCLQNNGENALAWDDGEFAVGSGLFYLVRATDFFCRFGSYDTGQASQSTGRDPGVDAAAAACP